MTREEFLEFLKKAMDHLRGNGLLKLQGRVFYSSYATLQKGDLYVLGLNPGARQGGYPCLQQDLEVFPTKKTHDYFDDSFRGYDPGEAPLQIHLRALVEQCLGYNLRDICTSNLIFVASPNARGAGYPASATKCWPIHQMVICDIVKPTTILVFGNGDPSPYQFIASNYEVLAHRSMRINIRRSLKFARVRIGQLEVNLIGVPHLSWFAPNQGNAAADIARWLQRAHTGALLQEP